MAAKDAASGLAVVGANKSHAFHHSFPGGVPLSGNARKARGVPPSPLLRDEAFRRLVEGARDYAIFMLTPEGIVATWNVGAER